MSDLPNNAECRGCRKPLRKSDSGGYCYDQKTGKEAIWGHYGGWACSRDCEFRASLELERSMPGHNATQTRLSCYAAEALRKHWGN